MRPDAEYYLVETVTEVIFPASGAEDLRDPRTGRTVIPERVHVRFTRRVTPEEDGGREWASVTVYGPRRLKSGEPGQEIGSFGWAGTFLGDPQDRPEWLTGLLADHMPEGWNPVLLRLKGVAS